MEPTPIYIITLFLLIVAIGIIMLVLVYQKKQVQYFKEKQQLQNNYQQELLRTQLEIQEQTFKNISQEIHDNIGQVLSLVKLNISSMDCNEPKILLQQKIKSSSELMGKAIQDLRDLSKSLHTDFISEMGLIKAIEYELDLMKKAGDYDTVLTIEGERYNLPKQKELILFRILQEILNNIIKHAKASAITVLVCYYPGKFFLQVTDNGSGFNISEPNNINGLGIKNMKNRSELIGANYNIDSKFGIGTIVKTELALNSET